MICLASVTEDGLAICWQKPVLPGRRYTTRHRFRWKRVQAGEVTSLSKRLGVQAFLMHCGLVGGDFTGCIITVPALTVTTSEVAWISWWRVDVRVTEETGGLDDRERELA